MSRKPTIIDVARAAGVSKSTVSLVLRGDTVVRPQTRDRVRRAMADLGYVYNRAAAQMRGPHGGLIGLVINDLRNPFFAEFAISAQMTFLEAGFATVIANTDETPDIEAQVVAAMVERGVAAVIISPAYGPGDGAFAALERAGVPTLQVLRRRDEWRPSFPFASFDYAAGGRLAVDHMIAAGARRIAFVGGLPERPVTEERMRGWRAGLRAAGLETLALHGRPTRRFGREAARRVLAEKPALDAALCFNDLVALGLMTGLREAGVAVGVDFSVAGCDDIDECSDAWPALASIQCDISGFGRHAADAILRWLGEGVAPPDEHRTGVRFIARGSVGGGIR